MGATSFRDVFQSQPGMTPGTGNAFGDRIDQSVQALAATRGQDDEEVIRLTGIYHNLVRRWGDA